MAGVQIWKMLESIVWRCGARIGGIELGIAKGTRLVVLYERERFGKGLEVADDGSARPSRWITMQDPRLYELVLDLCGFASGDSNFETQTSLSSAKVGIFPDS